MKLRATATPIDQIKTECVVLGFFEDERPLKGQTGLTDWRMCGLLSRHLMDGFISGAFGETLFFPVGRHMACSKALLLGLGKKPSYTFETFSVTVRKTLDTLFKLGIGDIAMPLPGVDGSDIDPNLAAHRFCEALAIRYRDNAGLYANLQVTIVSQSENLKQINPVLANFERKISDELGIVH